MSNTFGPDGNLPLDPSMAFTLIIPEQATVTLTFSSVADWENGICVYDANYNLLGTRGNQAGWSLTPPIVIPAGKTATSCIITGWHKEGPADPSKPWVQSDYKITGEPDLEVVVGFNDTGSTNYNNIEATIAFS